MSRRVGGNKPTGPAAKKAAALAQAKKLENEQQLLQQQREQQERDELESDVDQQQTEAEGRKKRIKPLVLRVDNPTHTCPFFALAMAGETKMLEEHIRAKMLLEDSKLLYLGTAVVSIPGYDLFAPLRLVDTNSGGTLLHFAALGNVETVRLLLSYGMNIFINSRNRTGASPIFLAAGRGHLDIVKLLVTSGASLNIYTNDGASLLHSAVMSGSFDLVYYLLSLPKIDVNMDDDEFMTPLGLAITRVSELRKQLDELDVLLKESIDSIMVNAASFIMDENELVEESRRKLGLSNDEDATDDPDLKFLTSKDQELIMKDFVASNETIVGLKFSLKEGTILLHNFIRITEALLNPPIFTLTVPEVIHEHRPKNVPSKAKMVKEMEEKQEQEYKDSNLGEIDASPAQETPEASPSNEDIQNNTDGDTGVKTDSDAKAEEMDEEDDPTIEIFEQNGKKYTRRPAQRITHTPDRAKVVHFPPYISYWMLLVETQELPLIKTCLEKSEIDVNWTFPMGNNISNATALHYAVDLGNIELAKLLIDHGADPGAELDIKVSLATNAEGMVAPERAASPEDALESTPPTSSSPQQLPPRNRHESSVSPGMPVMIDVGYELLNNLYKNVSTQSNQFIEARKTKQKNRPVDSSEPKKHEFVGFVSKQQGFTPLLAALYNRDVKMAQFLISHCHSRCLGQTYLSTHNLTPYPNLLTSELLETLPPEDVEKQFQQQQLEQSLKQGQGSGGTHEAPQITSLMDLLRTLSPFLTIMNNEIMAQRQQAEQVKKNLAKIKKDEEDAEFAKAQLGQDGDAKATGLDDIDDTLSNPPPLEEVSVDVDVDLSPLDNVNSFIPDALRVAINNGYDEITHSLLTLGVDINAPYFKSSITMTKNRPLEALTEKKEQYEYNVTIELTDMGFTPLFNAIKTKNTAIVRQLLSIGCCLDMSLYSYLLSLGIDINRTYYLPLYNETIDVDLITKGQEAVESETTAQQGLELTSQPQQIIRIDFMSPTASLPAVIQSVQYHPDVLHMLVAHDDKILKQVTNDGRNALHYAADLNKPILSTYLLSNDPLSMFSRENAGLTPLALAVAGDHAEICKLFMTFQRRLRSPLVVFHPHRPALVWGDDLHSDVSLDRVNDYYYAIDHQVDFYPVTQPRKPLEESHLDEIDAGSETDDEKVDEDSVQSRGDGESIKQQQNDDNRRKSVIKPYWVDLVVEQENAEFIFNPKGFDQQTFELYHKYVTTQYYPVQDSKLIPPPTATQTNHSTFTTYHPTYDEQEYNPLKQQLQSQPLRWFGCDIACANILSFYYAIVNNPADLRNESLITSLQPFIRSIDGIYGHIVRAFRLSGLGGAIFSLKQLSSAMIAYPQTKPDLSLIPTPQEIVQRNLTPVPSKPYSLWVELVVPTQEQLSTLIATAGGYQLLANNIIVDQHGFIVRNVTYQYVCESYRLTNAQGLISTTRLCLPMVAYLSTELLSPITKNGFTFLLGEALGNQALPLLHGLRGETFIRCFHQFYMCNPLYYNHKAGLFNFNGVIVNRKSSLPFSPFMKNDVGVINIPMTKGTKHFIVSKSIITERLKVKEVELAEKKRIMALEKKKREEEEKKNKKNKNQKPSPQDNARKEDSTQDDETVDYPALVDTDLYQSHTIKPVSVYKVSTFSPLHLAVINDHIQLLRLLIGLAPFQQQERDDGGDVASNPIFGNDEVTSLDVKDDDADEDDEDDDLPELVSVDDEHSSDQQLSPQSVMEDILLQPRHSQTLATLVKALNILPDSPHDGLSFGPDMEDDDEDNEDNEEGEQESSARHEGINSNEAEQQQQEDREFDPNDPMLQGVDLQSLLDQMISDNNTQEELSRVKEEEKKKQNALSMRLSKLPPLLHVPQPSDPTFQLINRLAVYPMTVLKEVEVENDADTTGPKQTTQIEQTIDTIIHPLHLCALHDLVDSAEILIQYGAIIDVQDHDGNTPLHLAIRDGSRLVLEVLLSYSANLNVQNNDGNTPIHLAVQNGDIGLAKMLLNEYRPDFSLKNNEGKTAQETLNESEARYNKYLSDETEIQHDENLTTFAALFTPEGQKVNKGGEIKSMSVEERRKFNLDQIQLLRDELQKMRAVERQ